jgi:hypothetical protein
MRCFASIVSRFVQSLRAPSSFTISRRGAVGSARAFGIYAGQHDILHLEPGTGTDVRVLGVANWELGSVVGGWSFAVFPMTTAAGKEYMKSLAELRQL